MKIAFIAGMVGFAILGIALGPNPIGQGSMIVAALFGLGALIHWLVGLRPKPDAYDLAVLRQIHERENDKVDEEELEQYETTGQAICLNCGDEYDPRLGRCPRCRCY